MIKKLPSLYRFIAICFIGTMGLIGLCRQHIVTFRNGDLRGDEAFAFGLACIGAAIALSLWDYLHIRRTRLEA